MTPGLGPGIVICSLEAWDDTWRRNQFLVAEVMTASPGVQVLFVEPPLDAAVAVRNRKSPVAAGLRHGYRSDLWLFQPSKILPNMFGKSAQGLLDRSVMKTAYALGLRDPILWINDSRYADFARRTGWPTLYDITDDWLLEEVPAAEARRRKENDRRLLADARVVVVCSEPLRRSRGHEREVRLITNAVDPAHIRAPQERPADLPPSPTAVYVGTLHEQRIDLDLVATLAEAIPSLHVVLVGPNALSAAASRKLEAANVTLLGPRPYEVIPAYLQHADMLIVPHLVTPFTRSLDPIKAYEIAAVGRPGVATAVAGFTHLPPPAKVVAREQFIEAVRDTLRAGPAGAAGPYLGPTWQGRGEEFMEALRDVRLGRGSR